MSPELLYIYVWYLKLLCKTHFASFLTQIVIFRLLWLVTNQVIYVEVGYMLDWFYTYEIVNYMLF